MGKRGVHAVCFLLQRDINVGIERGSYVQPSTQSAAIYAVRSSSSISQLLSSLGLFSEALKQILGHLMNVSSRL
ncbi:hypothetical protein OUZ56_004875 [Daphnia magna]|uniref:Uncharacterized protein n=1 Tax=Daphnia magna TaxID=35525 RepID=A0ABQ9YR49_9CRUS|nr:hypothetical protein OUZ56_004875 [Daphnia magna]